MPGTTPRAPRPDGARGFPWGWCVLVLLVASCLRPALTSVGPVVQRIQESTGLGSAGIGLLGALPLLAFAALSPVVALPAQRLGIERVVLAALMVLGAGILLRSAPAGGMLWVGTVLIGTGIAIGNVLVPVIVKRDFSQHVSVMTGMYTAVLSVAAATASGLTAPLAGTLPGGWRSALGLWALPPLLAAIWWAVRTRGVRRSAARKNPLKEAMTGALPLLPTEAEPPATRAVSLLRSPTAWAVTAFMGLQSAVFYTLGMWLPAMEAQIGIDASRAGLHLFVMQSVGIAGNLAVSALAERRPSQSWLAVLFTGFILVAVLGALALPGAALLWAGLVGIGCSGSFAMALAMIGLRTQNHAQTMKLSGMAQCLGYLVAALGPLLAGALSDAAGTWAVVLWALLGVGVVQLCAGAWAGRPGRIGADRR